MDIQSKVAVLAKEFFSTPEKSGWIGLSRFMSAIRWQQPGFYVARQSR